MKHYLSFIIYHLSFRHAVLAVMTVSAIFTASTLLAKNVVTPQMYMFGFAASFNDTIVHFTEIQQVDSTWTDQKGRFLLGRDNYSYQLRDYLTNQLKMPNRTCIVVFNKNKKKLEKHYLKMKRQYDGPKVTGFDIRTISTQDFRFLPINMSVKEETPVVQKPEKKKKSKKAKKQK